MKQHLKIGYVFDDSLDRSDGVQQYILTLGRYFMSQGHQVHYLVGQSDPAKRPKLTIHSLSRNVAVRANQNRLSIPLPAAARPITHLLNQEEYDVLHVQVPYSPLLGGRILRRVHPKTRVIGTFHIVGASRFETWGSKVLSTFQRRTLSRFDKFVAVSAVAQAFAKRTYGLSMPVVPNAVELSRFADKKPLPQLADIQSIVYINRLVERKGCRHLIEAVHHLDSQGLFNKRQLIVCGQGPLRASLERLVKGYNLEDKVSFAGFISEADKPRYLASAQLACYPSTAGESFGIVLIEAMAAGALTLGGNNPGYATVLGQQPELLIDPTNTRAFAERIDRLLRDKALRQKLGQWQAHAIQQYDVSRVGRQLLELYRGQELE